MNPLMLIPLGISLISQIIGNARARQAAALAERKTESAADRVRTLGKEYLQRVGGTGDIRTMTKAGIGQLGGGLAAAGLMGSSLGGNAMMSVLSDVMARTYPARMNALANAYQMLASPEQMLADFYMQGAKSAAESGGMDMSGLGYMFPYLANMGGSGTAGVGGYGYTGGAGGAGGAPVFFP